MSNPGSSTGGVTQVASTASAAGVTLKAANVGRRGLTIENDSTAVLYVLYGTGTVSTTNYSVKVLAGGYLEVPYGFTGIVQGIWASANGYAYVTELT